MKGYTPILGTLGYVLSADQQEVLMIHRNQKVNDDHLGKYNGLGGKVHRNEDVATSMKREIKEEAGINVLEMNFCGTINWTGFGKNEEDWLGFIFLITKWEGKVLQKCPEGDLQWIKKEKIFDLPMWEGDKHFLPYVFSNIKTENPFHGFMAYKNQTLLEYTFST